MSYHNYYIYYIDKDYCFLKGTGKMNCDLLNCELRHTLVKGTWYLSNWVINNIYKENTKTSILHIFKKVLVILEIRWGGKNNYIM